LAFSSAHASHGHFKEGKEREYPVHYDTRWKPKAVQVGMNDVELFCFVTENHFLHESERHIRIYHAREAKSCEIAGRSGAI
jgi:hypothetical protein